MRYLDVHYKRIILKTPRLDRYCSVAKLPNVISLPVGTFTDFQRSFIIGKLLLTEFTPEYHFDASGKTSSFVRYESRVFGNGYLNADGTYDSTEDGKSLLIDFKRFWVDLNTDTPSTVPASNQQGLQGVAASLVQNLGVAAFFKPLSTYPVLYLDSDLCVFEFPPLGVRIAAERRPE